MDMGNNGNIKILSLESAGASCSVALHIDGELISEYTINAPNLHDRLLADFAKRTLNDLQMNVSDLDAVAVSAGPGSFTGLRICGSLGKALAYGNSPRLIAVPTMHALAYSCILNLPYVDFNAVVATVKAHKDLLYYQVFSKDFTFTSEPVFITQDEFLNFDFGNAMICGTAADLFPKYFSINGYNKLSAKYIGELAYKMYQDGDFTNSDEYTPLYIQEFEPKTLKKDIAICS